MPCPTNIIDTEDDFTPSISWTTSAMMGSTSYPKLLQKQLYRAIGFIVTEQINHEMFAKSLLREVILRMEENDNDDSDTMQTVREITEKVSCIVDSYKNLEQYATNMTNMLAAMGGYNVTTSKAALSTKLLSSSSSDGQKNGDQLQQQTDTASLAFLKREMEGSNKSSAFIVVLSDIYEIIRIAKAAAEAKASMRDSLRKSWVAPSSFERETFKYWIENGRMTDVLLACVKEAPLLAYGAAGRLTSDEELNRSEGDKLWNNLASVNSSVYFDTKTMCMYKERILRRERSQLFRIRWYGEYVPSRGDTVFLELKTHHEKWTNESSIKQRVSIRAKYIKAFLSRTNTLTQYDAKQMIRQTCPELNSTQLEKSAELLLSMNRLVKEFDLRPCIRTKYERVAFQSSENNKLRLTIDRNIFLIDESKTPQGSWCLPDAAIHENIIKKVPFDVLEVKLSGGQILPQLIEILLEDRVIIEAAKFSKFVTGAAAFNADKVCSLPYWTENIAFAPLFGNTNDSKTTEPRKECGTTTASSPVRKSYDRKDTEITQDISDNTDMVENRKGGAAQKGVEHWKGLVNYGTKAMTKVVKLGDMSSRNGTRKRQPSIAPKKAVRVEPKSFFANERTFIQWVSGAILLFTIALIMLEYGSVPLQRSAIAFLFGAMMIVAYSLFVYRRRVRLLTEGEPYGYVDHCGPTVLGSAVFLGLLVIVSISLKDHAMDNKQNTLQIIQPKSDVCVQHEAVGLSKLKYQPSDIHVLETDDRLMVVSLETILRYDSVNHTEVLATIPGADLEGLTSVGDRIFALSEIRKKKSELIELQWDTVMKHLVYTQRWEILTPKAEGITFIPGNPVGELYISGDLVEEVGENVADRGIIDVYEIPDGPQTEELKGHRLNSDMLNEGLVDSKIAAMQYFEGALYVLHDNDKVVRSWDVKEGKLLSEWKLPQFSKQWEGMALQRRCSEQVSTLEKNEQQLRGSTLRCDEDLLLHLALDSPPQVWTIKVKQEEVNGTIILPDCARV